MLRSIYLFFRKEPGYFWILGVLVMVYAFVYSLKAHTHHGGKKVSKEITAFAAAERKWSKEMEHEELFRDFVKQKPVLALLFQSMTAFFFLAFLAGIVVNGVFLWRKCFRRDLFGARDPPLNFAWPFSILFKVVLLFLFWGAVLSLGSAVFEHFFPKAASENFYILLRTLMMHGITLAYMIRFIRQQGSRWQDLGFQLPSGQGIWQEIKMGFVGYFGVLPLFAVVVSILFAVAHVARYEPPPHPLINMFLEGKHAPFLFGASLLLGTVIGPVLEEIFFRGFCYPILRNRWGSFWAIVLSAAFFAGIHYSTFVFWPIFVLGVVLAYLYEKRKSLIASITLHILHNTLFIAYFLLVRQILGDRGF